MASILVSEIEHGPDTHISDLGSLPRAVRDVVLSRAADTGRPSAGFGRGAGGGAHSGIAAWTKREMANCACYVGVQIDRRLQLSMAQQASM
jgi:hypothetical protein